MIFTFYLNVIGAMNCATTNNDFFNCIFLNRNGIICRSYVTQEGGQHFFYKHIVSTRLKSNTYITRILNPYSAVHEYWVYGNFDAQIALFFDLI